MSVYSDNQTSIINDLIDMENEMGDPAFTWKGNNYVCVPSSNSFKYQLDGAFIPVKTLNLTVRLGVLPTNTIPESEDLITYNGEQYRIDNVVKDPLKVFVRLMCSSNINK